MIELKIDPEFRDKIPPLTDAEFEQLEENMDEATRAYLNSSPRYMMIMIDFLREHYGSAYSYLLDIGLTEDEINDIKDSFII